jgi:O-antigen ligase
MSHPDLHTQTAGRPFTGAPSNRALGDVRSPKLAQDRGEFDTLQRFLWGALIASFPFTALEMWPSKLKQFGEPAVLIAALLGVLVVGDAVLRPQRIFVPKGRSAWLLLVFMAVIGASFFISHPLNPYMWPGNNPWTKSAKQIAQWFADGWIAYLTLRFVRTWKDFRFALKCQFIALLLVTASAFLELAALHWPAGRAHTLYAFLHNGGMENAGRLNLLGYEPSIAGDYLISVIPLFVCGAYYWKPRRWVFFWSAVALLLFCGTFSLGCFGALFIAALAVGIVYARRGSKSLIAATLLLLCVLVGAAVSSSKGEEFLGDRVSEIIENGFDPSSIPDYSTRDRLAHAEACFNLFLEHPLIGVGEGKSGFYVYSSYPVWALDQDVGQAAFVSNTADLPTSFNLFLQMLAETGLVGTAIFVALLISMLADCYGAMNAARDKWKRMVFAGILLALAAQIVHYNAMMWLGMRYWFFIWGLAMCAPQLLRQRDPRMPERRIAMNRDDLRARPFTTRRRPASAVPV